MCAAAEAPQSTQTDAQLRELVDGYLQGVVAEISNERLREAGEYALLGGGKRVRPVLALRTCQLLGGSLDDGMPVACGFEMIHAFSLIHDDLPALDNDDMRRGKPTVHKAFGESLAILAGDMLQSMALVVTAKSPRNADRLVLEVATATCAMIEGQAWDTEGGMPASLTEGEKLDLIHRNKTAALIRGACRSGAIAADAGSDAIDAIDRWGAALGMMFQVVDDILDETQTSEHLGKTAGKDQEQGKMTYPAVHGLKKAQSYVRELELEAADALSGFGDRAQELRNITNALAVRTR